MPHEANRKTGVRSQPKNRRLTPSHACTADEVFDAMVRLSASHRTAFVIVTHDNDLAARAQRVYELRDGVLHTARS
jgi:predicted ABC-type transport system involved in lysophospholipase L1 biosynthesis ATPase subunit